MSVLLIPDNVFIIVLIFTDVSLSHLQFELFRINFATASKHLSVSNTFLVLVGSEDAAEICFSNVHLRKGRGLPGFIKSVSTLYLAEKAASSVAILNL